MNENKVSVCFGFFAARSASTTSQK